MGTLDSSAYLARARGAVGTARYPQGMCLNAQWNWAGAVPSIAPAAGHMDTAQHAWEAVEERHRHHGDYDAPPGVAAFFGPSPTRTDRNRDAGDIVTAIGSRLCVATDAFGAVIGIMTLEARARQIQRPFLGWGETLGGHHFSAVSTPVTPAAVNKAATQRGLKLVASRIVTIKINGKAQRFLVNPDTMQGVPKSDSASLFYKNSGYPFNPDPQDPGVLSGYVYPNSTKSLV